jgi:transposase
MILNEKVFQRNVTISCQLSITFSIDIKTCVGKMEFLSEINWKRGQPIHEIEKNLIVYLLGANFTPKEIAFAISRDTKCINKWIDRYQRTGMMNKVPNPGRPKLTTTEDEFNILFAAVENPFRKLNDIKEYLGTYLSKTTISRRLRESKYYACVARAKEFLSPGHRAYRLQFAEQYINFDQWNRTLFVDESTFQTGSAVRTLVRRPLRSPFDERYLKTVANSGRQSISVFRIMSAQGLGSLIRIDGRFDSERYLEILDNIVLPYIEDEFEDGNIFYYQNNSPIHRSRVVRDWFNRNFTPGQLIATPAKSPDINLIENAWGRQKIKVSETGIYADENDLWLAISDAWLDMQDNYNCQRLVNSIPNRLQNIIDSNGGHTKY